MRTLLIFTFIAGLTCLTRVGAADNPNFDYEFALSFETNVLDNVGLGSDPTLADPGEDPVGDRLIAEDYEFEFGLTYQVNDNLYLFFSGSLIDETETLELNNFIDSSDLSEEVSGLERKEMGVGVYFGEEIDSEFILGRLEFVSTSEWWIWWDEELDAISLDSAYGNFETLIGVAEEQWERSTDDDFVDPEIDGIRRIIASLSWEFAEDQSLNFYYLDQDDNSSSCTCWEISRTSTRWMRQMLISAGAGSVTWASFDVDKVGEIEVELHYCQGQWARNGIRI